MKLSQSNYYKRKTPDMISVFQTLEVLQRGHIYWSGKVLLLIHYHASNIEVHILIPFSPIAFIRATYSRLHRLPQTQPANFPSPNYKLKAVLPNDWL